MSEELLKAPPSEENMSFADIKALLPKGITFRDQARGESLDFELWIPKSAYLVGTLLQKSLERTAEGDRSSADSPAAAAQL